MAECSVENCRNECFDAEQNKCILHCRKDKKRNHRVIEEFNFALKDLIDREMEREVKIIRLNNLHFPLNSFSDEVITKYDKLEKIRFFDCYFYGKEDFFKLKELKLEFDNCHFYENIKDIRFQDVFFHKCEFYKSCELCNQDSRKIVIENCFFMDCKINTINFKGLEFTNKLFLNCNINNLILNNCIFNSDFILIYNDISNKSNNKINLLNFDESTFNKKVKIQFHNISEATFYNTKFENLADFYQTKFNNVIFERTDFKNISVFSETEFNCDVDFKYTKFLGKSIFRDMVIKGKLNLRDTIFADDANFLDITSEERKIDENGEFYGEPKVIQVANRETARIIKNFYDSSNNIIEANKFYALEMKKREKELTKDIENGRNIVDWLIFKAHAISSNHSQDWLLALFWIIVIGALYTIISFCSTNTCLNNINTPILIGSIFLVSLYSLHVYNKNDYKQFTKYIFLFLLFVNYFALTKDVTLSCLADKINPFSIMTSEEPITFGLLMFKITIAYLIYQFIVSVRQNTRRK